MSAFAVTCVTLILALSTRWAQASTTPPLAVKNLTAWYDSSDTSTLTTVSASAGAVAQWTDKSGNGWTLYQNVLAQQPTRVASGINGLGSMVFNGSSVGFSTAVTVPYANVYSTSSVFVVQNATTTSGITVSAGLPGQWDFGSAQFAYYGNTLNDASAPTGAHLWSGIADLSGSTQLFRIDGTTVGTQVPATAPSPSADCQLTVGSEINASCSSASPKYFSGQIGEIIVVSSALSVLQYDVVEGYLACKWGLQAQLPITHPFHSLCPTLYSPTSISGLLAWYDASDPTTVTTGLTYVTQMTDKSGNGNTLTSTMPPSLTTIGGLNALNFNGDQRLSSSTTNTAVTGSSPSSIFAVASAPATLNATATAVMYGLPSLGSARMILANTTYKAVSSEYPTLLVDSSQWSRTTSPTLVFASYGGTTQAIAVNGGALVSANNTPATATSTAITLGATATSAGFWTQFWNGPIDEVLLYNSALSLAEQQFVEGYLACKWSIQGNLPAGHPYKSACPTSATANLTLSLAASSTTVVPGTVLTYTTTFINSSGSIVYSPVVITPIPPNADFELGSPATSLSSTGLTPTIAYSNDGGTTYTYTPVSGAGGAPAGYDRTVTHVRWTLSGALGSVSPSNTGNTSYTVQIR